MCRADRYPVRLCVCDDRPGNRGFTVPALRDRELDDDRTSLGVLSLNRGAAPARKRGAIDGGVGALAGGFLLTASIPAGAAGRANASQGRNYRCRLR